MLLLHSYYRLIRLHNLYKLVASFTKSFTVNKVITRAPNKT